MRHVYDKTGRNGVCYKAARNAPVEFVQRIEKGSGEKNKAFVLPSPDFQRLCVEQLDLFRRIFNPDAVLSKAKLLQQSSWQNNVRMGDLVEQISYDIVEDILLQADCMTDTLQQLQDAVYTTKNMRRSAGAQPKSISSSYPIASQLKRPTAHHKNLIGDYQRLCEVFDVLEALVVAIKPLANKQQLSVELCDLSRSSQVAVDEPALRQALSNLIEGSLLRIEIEGKVEIMSTETPAGALIIIDDDGLDMHYMTQMHSLAPFGADLLAGDRIEDNMSWNFIAGLTVAREILESYVRAVRVLSPRNVETPVGAGGTRIELWLPLSPPTSSDRGLGSGCLKSK
ncbi:chloroplast sensor kinase, chloroplastic-like [Primulina tabacum]|uniref:chloroplast sensor kinase, chloroplastic-like n=1 Tax=Primulina tabacum TaxID=48773 RepID=UPI003F5A99A9